VSKCNGSAVVFLRFVELRRGKDAVVYFRAAELLRKMLTRNVIEEGIALCIEGSGCGLDKETVVGVMVEAVEAIND
jgi:hypothetical protein